MREAELQKVPIVAVIGDQEVTNETVTLRRRRDKSRGAEPLALGAFAEQLREAIASATGLTDHPEDRPIAERRPFEKDRERGDSTRINERIRAREIRVIGADGEQLGVMTPEAAIVLAEEAGLDLVEVAGAANPPVCRIMDYGKYKYERRRRRPRARPRGPPS